MTRREEILLQALGKIAKEYSSPERMASVIEHTLLKPNSGLEKALQVIEESSKYGFACAVLTPYHTRRVASAADDLGVKLCTVIGFPGGFQPLKAKLSEIEYVVDVVHGIDIVANIQAIVAGDLAEVERELGELVEYSKENGVDHVKVIVEAPLLDDNTLALAVRAVANAGADYVKTSTGVYSKGGDPLTVLRTSTLAREYNLMVKAAGGIRTAIDAFMALASGAHRLGTSSGPQVIETFKRLTQ
ncbi:MAG: deoxyribose-phosphate aldolase [Desulfurococcales archaeon]|nr:deoxyribose-phosphate aldolase [Desulfurococcales archaeon]